MLLLRSLACVCVLTGVVAGVTTETVVGVAGRKVTLPCRAEAVSRTGVEVCWGRGEPSLFTCHNAVINTAGDQTTYRKSSRYSSSSSSSSLSISSSRLSDSGFYHCRVQLPGLFNDQTSSVHLIILQPRSVVSEPSDREHAGSLDRPATPSGFTTTDVTEQTGSDVIGDLTTGPMVALVQGSVQQQLSALDRLLSFIGNTVRASFIVFIPALLLTTVHSFWRTNQRAETDKSLNQSEQEEDSSV